MKTKHLNTYVDNICSIHTFNERYCGLRIIVSHAAMQELMNEAKTLYDVVEILEFGKDAPRKRKQGIIEKWFNESNNTFNVVIAKSYDEIMNEECWILIHFGKFTKKKRKK
ncbi:MAG: hypothetical protein WC916_07590 [Candidatus Woesearchaeota archaeon]